MGNNCAIIGDIRKSRKLDNWQNIFMMLERTLREVDNIFSDVLVVTFSPTTGDEFQGAIGTPEKAFEIRNFMRNELQELQVDFYYGIGIGNIEKPFPKEMGMRGSAFYRARAALDVCKKKNRGIFVKSSEKANSADNIMNTLLLLIETLENSWTRRQREIVNYYRVHRNYSYEQVSKHFNISKPAVSQFLKATNWEALTEGDNLVNKLFKDMYLRPGLNTLNIGQLS